MSQCALIFTSPLAFCIVASHASFDEHLLPIADALAVNATLRKVDFSRAFPALGNDLADMVCGRLADVLRVNKSVKCLRLCDNRIGCDATAVIGGLLKENSTIRELDLSDNYCGPVGLCAIAGALRVNTTLRVLNLASINSNDVGGHALVEALSCNTTLRELRLTSTQWDEAVVRSLLVALAAPNASLRVLDIGGLAMDCNPLAPLIADVFRRNSVLADFWCCSHSAISMESLAVIFAALENNDSLCGLSLNVDRDVVRSGIRTLGASLETNYSLRNLSRT